MSTKDHLWSFGTVVSAALVASASCCAGPVFFLLFGVSIGALSALSALEPYRIWFITVALAFWGHGFYRLYLRQPATACAEDCERPSARARVLLWVALAVLVLAIVYPNLATHFLDS